MPFPHDPMRSASPGGGAPDATRDPDPGRTRSGAYPNAATSGDGAPTITTLTPSSSDRYALGEEIAHGGMGVVYRATDTVLGREVAIKVLQDKYAPGSGAARRFADEARIAAQLQHPAIPPIHDLGALPDGRPFLAMKLIKGDTLEALLKARPESAHDRGRFVAVFEQVCQAIAYAHAHDVIHRDLKPANVMVGAFGEVQVMDWGLAKVLTGGGGKSTEADPAETRAAGTEIRSLRESDGSETQAGSVLGTPAFMPPEQAVGAVGKIDARSDVFGLGAVLAVILTGEPPFAAASAETTRVKAAQGDVAECFARLGSCGAEPDLVALAKRCLSPKPVDRPANAGEVAGAVAGFRAAAADRARQAEVERAKAEVYAAEQRKRRRTALVTAAALCLVLTLGIVGTVIGMLRADEQRKGAEGAREAEAEQRQLVERQRDEIAEREQRVTEQQQIAQRRSRAFAKAVDGFANEAPAILDGHPLGSAPLQELLQLSIRLSREAREEAGEEHFGTSGEMTTYIRQGHFARTQGRIDDAEKHYNEAFKIAEQNFRTQATGRHGVNAGNFALLIGQRAAMVRIRAETRVGWKEEEKGRELFAEAVRMHHESIALYRRVVEEPQMRDIHVGEARTWLGGAFFELAETHRLSVVAFDTPAGKRAAYLAARDAAKEAEEQFAAGLASDWKDRAHRVERMRLRQALATYERARAADKLEELTAGGFFTRLAETCQFRAEADAAFQRGFDLYDRLVKDTPKNLLHRIQFAKLAADQGAFLMMKLRDAKRAEAAFRAAVEQNRRVGRPNELTHYHSEMGSNLYRQGVAASVAGDKTRARELFRRCVEVNEEQLREAIRVSSETSLYTLHPRLRLMFAQARAGDHVAAAKYAAVVRQQWDTNGEKLSYAAQGFALASTTTDDGALATDYLNKAFEALSRAAEVGHDNVAEVERDPDYDSMRGDPRFAPLAAKVRANAAKKK